MKVAVIVFSILLLARGVKLYKDYLSEEITDKRFIIESMIISYICIAILQIFAIRTGLY